MRIKATILVLICLILFTFWTCTSNKSKKVVILKYATHPALDELEAAYVEKLDGLIKVDSALKDFTIEKYNANGSPQTAKAIAESFNDQPVVLILTIGTPAAIAVANTKSDIPFLYGAVADPQGAGVIPSTRATGIQNAGENIINEAVTFIKKAFPNAKRLGTIYNPGEQNSVFVQRLIKRIAEDQHFELKQVQVGGGSQLSGITETLCDEVDVIYSANDNTVNAGVASIVSVASKKKKPFVIGDLSTLSKGPLFAVGLEYKSMGAELGDISYKILKGGKISDFPPQPAPKPEIWLNSATEKELGYIFPDQSVSDLVKKRIN
jgi:putative ABC transport system substrate-binding protein